MAGLDPKLREKVIKRVGLASRFEQLAEECCELAQAALKMSRMIRGENEPNAGKQELDDNLNEEIVDVLLCIDMVSDLNVLGGAGENVEDARSDASYKLRRWVDRLETKDKFLSVQDIQRMLRRD